MARQAFTITWAADQTTSNTLNLGDTGFDIVFINNEAGAEITFQGSTDGTNFYTIDRENSAVAGQAQDVFTVGSSVSGNWIPAEPLRCFQYVRCVATATAAGGTVYLSTSFAR